MATGFDDFESTAVDATPSNLTTFGAQTAVVKADGTASNGKHLLITRTAGGGDRGVTLDDMVAAFVGSTDTMEIVVKIKNISGQAGDDIEIHPGSTSTNRRKYARIDSVGTDYEVMERTTVRNTFAHGLTLTDWWIVRIRTSKTEYFVKAWQASGSEPGSFSDYTADMANNDDQVAEAALVFAALASSRAIAVDWYGWATGGATAPMTSAGDPPQGTVTISSVVPDETTAVVTYSYNDTDETGYEYRIDNGTPAAIGASPATITGLTAATTYNSPGIQVRAVNGNGDGAWSTAEPFTTTAATEWAVTVTLINPADDTPRASLTGLKYTVYDGMPWDDPAVLVAGEDGTTDASGVFDLVLPGGNPAAAGDVVWLLVTNNDDSPTTESWTTGHPVTAAQREV